MHIQLYASLAFSSAAICYLAPADYHHYHMPVAGKISHVSLLNQHRYSVTVKPYIFSSVNILTRNRRALVVIEVCVREWDLCACVCGGGGVRRRGVCVRGW